MGGGTSTDEQERRVLRHRAKMLAITLTTPPTEGELIHALRFSLGEESYAVEAIVVREVFPLPLVAPLPCVPSFVRGIINVRGRIVSVLDLKAILGLPDSEYSATSCVIVLHSPALEFGLLADEIYGLASIPISSLQAALPALTGPWAEYVKGVTADGLVLLDAEKLLSGRKLIVDETVGGTG